MSFNSNKLHILLHFLSWAILFCIPFIGKEVIHSPFLIKHSIQIITLILFFYANIFLLIPKLLFQNRRGVYIITVVLIVVIIVSINGLFDNYFTHEPPMRNFRPEFALKKHSPGVFRFIPTLFTTLLVFGISTSLKVFNEYRKKEEYQKEIENEKLNAELSFLKSQINPHFLFNTLNNIYSLASNRSPNTDKAILKLSDLMRYMLEETERNKVALSKEIEYLQTYLDLQKLRIHESVSVQFSTTGDFADKYIESLLLIPFIENAFKHGISYVDPSYIKIDLKIEGNKLQLTVDNSIPIVRVEKDKTSGIGLGNVIKRLHLLYPDKHKLLINHNESNYLVQLQLEL